MEWDEEYVLGELHRFMDGERCEGSDYRNPYGGNEIIAGGSSRRWDGESNGFFASRDLDSVLSWDGIFKDCELASIRDVNGSLYIEGTHHDGGVLLEVRQLSDEGQKIWDELYGERDWYFPDEGLDAMGKTYMYGDEYKFLRDLWENETLCPRVGYITKMFGAPIESYEHDGARGRRPGRGRHGLRGDKGCRRRGEVPRRHLREPARGTRSRRRGREGLGQAGGAGEAGPSYRALLAGKAFLLTAVARSVA